MNTTRLSIIVWLGCTFVLANCGWAQMEFLGFGNGIQGQGDSVIELKPELMRMKVDLRVSGKDLADALKKLNIRREEVEKQLEKLGAVKGSIKFSEPDVDQGQDQQERQMRQMMRARMAQQRGKKAEKLEIVKPEKVLCSVTAEWPMPAGNASELLIASQKLQDAVKEADFGGMNEKKEMTPEEEEMAEEMGGMDMDYDNGQPKPGEPSFIFVAKVPPADREKALAQAFREAKANATQLAKAAELELGTVRTLGSTSTPDMDDEGYSAAYHRSRFASYFRQGMGLGMGNTLSEEAFGMRPTPIKHRITVTATFAVK